MGSTIELRDLPPELLSELDERAREKGLDRQSYVLRLIERNLFDQSANLDEILRPIREDFAATGMSEQEIEAFVDAEVAAARRERANRK
jgi:metal-responsive CopG/Arc/MetJ family transcriptional regulator